LHRSLMKFHLNVKCQKVYISNTKKMKNSMMKIHKFLAKIQLENNDNLLAK
jgi:hypothetical protein